MLEVYLKSGFYHTDVLTLPLCVVAGTRCMVLYGQVCTNLFSVRLLSVLHGHSFFSSPPQRPVTCDFEGFSIPDFIHYIYFPILILEKEPVFSFSMLSAKQGNCWRLNPGPPALEASTITLSRRRLTPFVYHF